MTVSDTMLSPIEQHARATPERIAYRMVPSGATVTWRELEARSRRCAAALVAAGLRPGDVVAVFLENHLRYFELLWAAHRVGLYYTTISRHLKRDEAQYIIEDCDARVLFYSRHTQAELDPARLDVQGVIRVSMDGADANALDYETWLARQPEDVCLPDTPEGTDFLYSSGTTGLPKGVPVPLNALSAFAQYMRLAIDLREGDVFWNIADPGWAYGLYYAICGPLLLGQATTLYLGGFSAAATWQVIAQLGVTNLTGSPTAYRQLMAAGPEAAAVVKGQLRVLSSAGEPLNPEVIRWVAEHLGAPIHDHYGQTEMGMCVNNHHGLDHPVNPGSAGLAMPGFRVAVLAPDGRELGPGQPGELAIDLAHSPLMWFTGYLNQPTPAIADGWYRTGDSVELEPDGSISFISRADDVITSSGYRIGPFEVESALIEHPAVLESAVIGVPDPERTELVKAFIVLAPDFEPNQALRDQLQRHVRQRLSAHAYPREIDFVQDLPKTPSGKLQRFVLRKAEVEKHSPPPA